MAFCIQFQILPNIVLVVDASPPYTEFVRVAPLHIVGFVFSQVGSVGPIQGISGFTMSPHSAVLCV